MAAGRANYAPLTGSSECLYTSSYPLTAGRRPTHFPARSLPPARFQVPGRLDAPELGGHDGRGRGARLALAGADQLAVSRRRGDEHARAAAVLRRRPGRRAGRSLLAAPAADGDRPGPDHHRQHARRAHAARSRLLRPPAAADAGGGNPARPRARRAAELHPRRRRRAGPAEGPGGARHRHALGLAAGLARRRRRHRALRLRRRVPRGGGSAFSPGGSRCSPPRGRYRTHRPMASPSGRACSASPPPCARIPTCSP